MSFKIRNKREIVACLEDGLSDSHRQAGELEIRNVQALLSQLDLEVKQLQKKRQRLERKLKQLNWELGKEK